MELSFFSASPALLIAIFAVDLLIGDPVSKYHPVVIIGKCLRFYEIKFFEKKCWNRFGGLLLCLILCLTILSLTCLIYVLLHSLHESIAFLYLALLGGLLLAFRSLVSHARAVSPTSEGDLEKMKAQVSRIVGRDTHKMDEQGCRRAAIESLAESLVDGILTPIFCFALAGVPGMILFKIISTMDSMVGYKNERYHQFGWAGARLDDVFNWIPARLSWLSLVLISLLHPKAHAGMALKIGWRDQHYLPGFNSGWPEATMAGALNCRLVGPIWRGDQLATDLWLGHENAPEGGTRFHMMLAEQLVGGVTLLWMIIVSLLLYLWS